jgi:hypothetical protein
MNGLQTYLIVRRARRDRLAGMPKVRTREDREAARRMEALAFLLFAAVVIVPMVALFVDQLAGVDIGRRALLAVVEVAR